MAGLAGKTPAPGLFACQDGVPVGWIAIALTKAAVAFARKHGARAADASPRSGDERGADDNMVFGTEPMFKRAGVRVVRELLTHRRKTWPARRAMRIMPRA
jgi:hypothetical protein